MKIELFLLSIVTVVTFGNRIRCKRCIGSLSMGSCAHVSLCSEHEECFVRQYKDDVGSIRYDSGCASKTVCQAMKSRTNTSDLCYNCCSSDICNGHMCTSEPQSTNLECFYCRDILRPEYCSQLRTCGGDYECSTTAYVLSTTQTITYKLGCTRKQACKVIESIIDDSDFCVQCCNTNHCNTKLCSKNQPVVG